jgi:hypothetical protein
MGIVVLVWTASAPSAAFGQTAAEGSHHAGAAEAEKKGHPGPREFEAEFVASDIFRSGSYVQPLWRDLGFEGHYFGGKETDVGFTGASWTFRVRELELSPAFGVFFGNNQFATSPAIAFRGNYERRFFVTQGLVVQGFRDTPIFHEESEAEGEHHGAPATPSGFVRPTISDGNHVSVRWKRVTVGGTWEHIQFREGNEWKSGGRLGIRIFSRVSAVLYVLVPGHTEWRGGILIHPKAD